MAIVKFYDIEGKVVEEHEVPLSLEIKDSDWELLSKSVKRQQTNARRTEGYRTSATRINPQPYMDWRWSHVRTRQTYIH